MVVFSKNVWNFELCGLTKRQTFIPSIMKRPNDKFPWSKSKTYRGRVVFNAQSCKPISLTFLIARPWIQPKKKKDFWTLRNEEKDPTKFPIIPLKIPAHEASRGRPRAASFVLTLVQFVVGKFHKTLIGLLNFPGQEQIPKTFNIRKLDI